MALVPRPVSDPHEALARQRQKAPPQSAASIPASADRGPGRITCGQFQVRSDPWPSHKPRRAGSCHGQSALARHPGQPVGHRGGARRGPAGAAQKVLLHRGSGTYRPPPRPPSPVTSVRPLSNAPPGAQNRQRGSWPKTFGHGCHPALRPARVD